jgi:hypothetical protein
MSGEELGSDEAAIVARPRRENGGGRRRSSVGLDLLAGVAFPPRTNCPQRSTIVRLRVPVGSALGRRLRECTLEFFV